MDDEMQSHQQNNTWTLAKLPEGRKAIKTKWVFKVKENQNGHIVKYKARLVAKGCAQKYGIDYTETFSPVVRYSSIRFLIALAVTEGMKIHQMDAVTAFLQGELNESIYMEQPEKYDDGTNKVCKLNKAIYGLKQAGRQWNKKLDTALLKFGLVKCKTDPCIYHDNKLNLLVAIYVDDFLIFYKQKNELEGICEFLNNNFKMKDIGEAKSCIGIRIQQYDGCMELDQERYILDVLERFGMSDCKPVGTPSDTSIKLSANNLTGESLKGKIPYQEIVGSLLFIAQGTRPDIAFAVNNASRFNNNPHEQHWAAVKRILRNLRGTSHLKLRYTKKGGPKVHAYSDADWASDADERRSCSGYMIMFSNAAIIWCSKRQNTVALSSTEAEYIALSSAVCDVIWLKQLAEEIKVNMSDPIIIYCDNQSTIKLAELDAFRPRTKHIDIRFHHIRQFVESKTIHIKYLSTNDIAADSLTKAVNKQKHSLCTLLMGLN
jgi:hypothetical protein